MSTAKEIKTILCIDSYQDNHIWSKGLYESMNKYLLSKDISVKYKNIYLNAKEICSPERRMDILSAHLLEIKESVDLIVVSGLEATEHVLTAEDSILKKTPIVFGAFIDKNFLTSHPNPNLCGYVANIDFTNTVVTAREIFPLSRKGYVI